MDRSVKERLVGAAVLVLLGVWLIPWILDGPVETRGLTEASGQLRLPAPDRGERHGAQTVELDVERPEASGPLPQAAGSAPGAGRSAADAAESELEASSSAPSHEAAVQTRSPAPGSAHPEDHAVATAGDPAGWMVQLGSFGDEGNAHRQARRIETLGYEPVVSNFDSGGRTMYRVRIGPEASRERAEAAASSLAAHGFVAQLVAPE
jgi:DedD protein